MFLTLTCCAGARGPIDITILDGRDELGLGVQGKLPALFQYVHAKWLPDPMSVGTHSRLRLYVTPIAEKLPEQIR
jgi:hypothetical protein